VIISLPLLHATGSPHGDNIPLIVVILFLAAIGFLLVRLRR